jgi:MoxR-like ATPase
MSEITFAVRKLVPSSLGWFKKIRQLGRETAGKERGINLNSPIMLRWFPGMLDTADSIDVRCRYFAYDDEQQVTDIIEEASRPIRLQGGDKNWRLVGEAIEGDFWGTVYENDLLIMSYNPATKTLSWMIVRNSSAVSPQEEAAYSGLIGLLGHPTADRSMWLVDNRNKIQEILKLLQSFNPHVGALLLEQDSMYNNWLRDLSVAGFTVPVSVQGADNVDKRLLLALKAKPFVILTGLAGSGKTIIARAFAKWISADNSQYVVVPVGADWTNRDPILGYPDALNGQRYETPAALSLILRAIQNSNKPYFLILDEMNLSHVERYFADILSAIESQEAIWLHDGDIRTGVPGVIERLPENLFIIGTVNVDETTYMFSPKVLDRANVIEFRASKASVEAFMSRDRVINLDYLNGKGAPYAEEFLLDKQRSIILSDSVRTWLKEEISLFFEVLSHFGAEFGFRTISEIERYIFFHLELATNQNWDYKRAMDAQVFQKLLPRLNGSRRKLEPILYALGSLCKQRDGRVYDTVLREAIIAYEQRSVDFDQSSNLIEAAEYPLSCEKIVRMMKRLEEGFTSFAEA